MFIICMYSCKCKIETLFILCFVAYVHVLYNIVRPSVKIFSTNVGRPSVVYLVCKMSVVQVSRSFLQLSFVQMYLFELGYPPE